MRMKLNAYRCGGKKRGREGWRGREREREGGREHYNAIQQHRNRGETLEPYFVFKVHKYAIAGVHNYVQLV